MYRQKVSKTIAGSFEDVQVSLLNYLYEINVAEKSGVEKKMMKDQCEKNIIKLHWKNIYYSPGTKVEIQAVSDGAGKVNVSVKHYNIRSQLEALDVKYYWKELLVRLKEYLKNPPKPSFRVWLKKNQPGSYLIEY